MRFLRTWWRFLVAVQLLPALEGGEETLVGGQAVLEGVMMRSPHAWAIACRKPSGEVSTHSEPLERLSEKRKWMAWPVIRGVVTLGHAMTLGFRALKFSANVALDELQPEPAAEKKKLEISGWMAAVNIIISVGFFIFMYKFLPLLAATELKRVNPLFGEQIVFNLVDGVIRIALFLLFIWGVSLWSDIHRVYEYHGAEHKTVYAFENGDPLETRIGAEVFDLPSALRHQLSDDGDADLDHGVHPGVGGDPGNHVLGQVRHAHRAAAGDCGRLVRDHPLRRQASRIAVRADDRARPLAAAHHHATSVRRPGRVRHHRAGPCHGARKTARRRIGHCLAVPPRTFSPNSFSTRIEQ